MPQREAYTLEIPLREDPELADYIENLIEDSMRHSERSRWSAEHKLGVSDIGHCREYVRRMLMQMPFSDEEPDSMAAFVGTAVGDLIESKMGEEWTTQDTVVVEMEVDTSAGPIQLKLPGHPDAYSRKRVLDFKTTYSLEVKERYGPTLQQKFQPTAYAHSLIRQGLVDPDCTISLVYLDRSARGGSRPKVWSWDYDEGIIEAMSQWLSDVFEAMIQNDEAPRDKEREWCMDWCPFATDCRSGDTDVTGLLMSREVAAAAHVYREAQAQEREAKRIKDQASTVLKGISGVTTNGLSVRTTSVPPSYIEGGWRRGYERLTITPVDGVRKKS